MSRPNIGVLSVACILVLALSVGCAKGPEFNLVGKYEGMLSINGAPPSGAVTKLELKVDGTFMMDLGLPVEGRWSLAGQTVTLEADTVNGQSIRGIGKDLNQGFDRPLKMPVGEDGATLSYTQVDEKGKAEIVFRKQNQKPNPEDKGQI
jgi:hypothetical protein